MSYNKIVEIDSSIPVDVNIVSGGTAGTPYLKTTNFSVNTVLGGAGNVVYTLLTVPNTDNFWYKPINFQMKLATDATAANRTPYLYYVNPGAQIIHATPQPAVLQTASLNLHWEWSLNLPVINATLNNTKRAHPMPIIMLPKNYTWQLFVVAGQAGDVLSEMFITYETWEIV